MLRMLTALFVTLFLSAEVAAGDDPYFLFEGDSYKYGAGHYAVRVPPGVMPCMEEPDPNFHYSFVFVIAWTVMPCIKPPQRLGIGYFRALRHARPRKTQIAIIAVPYEPLIPLREDRAMTALEIAQMFCQIKRSRAKGNEGVVIEAKESPFLFGGLPGAACLTRRGGFVTWEGYFLRPWELPDNRALDANQKPFPWIEYRVEYSGPEASFDRHFDMLRRVLNAVALIPATADSADRDWWHPKPEAATGN
jgi:hypothetical protein